MRPLGTSDIERMLDVRAGRGFARERNRALVRAFADAGLGVSEALSLAPDDLDGAELRVTVRGSRGRSVAVSDEAMRDLVAWRSEREGLGLDAEGPLFCTEAGQPLEASYVRRFLAQLGRQAAIDTAVNARALREGFAARRLAEGASPRALQADLGHRRSTSTARYSRRLSPPHRSDGAGVGADLTEVLLASAHCGLVIVRAVRSAVGDVNGYVIDYVNPAAAGILGSSPERLVGSSVLDRFPNAATDGTFARWTVLINEQGRSGEEARHYEEAEGVSVFRVRRAACGDSIILSFDDRTETREANAREERRASEIAALMGAADEGLVLIDSVGRISSANRAAESILGVSLGGLIGRTHFDPRWQALREDGTPFPPEELRRPSPSPRGGRFVARSSASVTRAGESSGFTSAPTPSRRPAVPHSRRPWRSRTSTISADRRGRGRHLRGAPTGDGGPRHALGPLPAGRDHHRGVRGRGGPRRLLVRRTRRPTLRRGGPPG